MAKGTEHYRESELRRFTLIGLIVIVALGVGGFLMRQFATEKAGALSPLPHRTSLSEPVSTGSLPAR
jgi:hypothetical protein